ncbi:Nicotinamide/nicotinic acid mononucleotide adenylyltransferase 1 [Fusarium piperis]|uniref:Nicotinamide/nicotinic acid mononucleotide adenylyltransferase 1 n=1 Tax=Fusarium piperis TaxID=1435070 RepID=A0A9W8TE70_9HYPO|nr:Nicotinamide/nicotinic acid mononucleotide adenylyltransferase 1 [Fusarium piperis]
MCKLAAEDEYDWLTVDPWEAGSPTTIPTAQVLDHANYEVNEVMGGIECDDGTKKSAKIVLLAGLDLVQTMSTPGVWEKRELDHILSRYGLFALERQGTETEPALESLRQWRQNIHIPRKRSMCSINSQMSINVVRV